MKLLLFDIDGTLMNGKGIGRAAKKRAMIDVFGTAGLVDSHPFGGKTDWLLLSELLDGTGYTPGIIGERMRRYEGVMARHMRSMLGEYHAEPCRGAMPLIETLRTRADVVLGLVTGNISMTAPIKLEAAGFDPNWFVVGAYGSESLDRNDLPRLAIERAEAHIRQQIDPKDVIVIGDTPMDIACARAVGAVAVAVDTGFASRDSLVASKPDYHLADLTTFLEVVPLS